MQCCSALNANITYSQDPRRHRSTLDGQIKQVPIFIGTSTWFKLVESKQAGLSMPSRGVIFQFCPVRDLRMSQASRKTEGPLQTPTVLATKDIATEIVNKFSLICL